MFQRVVGRLGGRVFQRDGARNVARRLRSARGKNGSRKFSTAANGSSSNISSLAAIGGTVIGTAAAFSLVRRISSRQRMKSIILYI
jgi:hypothetical protein